MAAVELQGQCDARFKRVREIFEASFASGAELGAGLCVYLNGRLVIDLWGGFANHEKARPWRRDTLANVYSTTKGITALCAHQLVERGELDLDAPVARYWPEFAQNGKARSRCACCCRTAPGCRRSRSRCSRPTSSTGTP